MRKRTVRRRSTLRTSSHARKRPLAVFFAAVFAVLTLASSAPAQQDNQGPMAPPPKFEVNRIPSEPHPGPPPIPQDQIIEKIGAAEDAAQIAYASYSFTQTIRVEELVDGGGKFTVTGQSYLKPDGVRYWRMVSQPVTTLKNVKYEVGDVQAMMNIPLFFLTSNYVGDYNFLYVGQQKLDELNAYMFQVKPKHVLRGRRYFQGLIYVDDHDLAIVETYGKFVSLETVEGPKLPFDMFEVYRENFQGKYWLPSYISSDDYIDVPNADQMHIRLVVRSSDFKLPVAPAPAAPASSVEKP